MAAIRHVRDIAETKRRNMANLQSWHTGVVCSMSDPRGVEFSVRDSATLGNNSFICRNSRISAISRSSGVIHAPNVRQAA